MGRLVVTEFITLDGVIEAPEKWSFPFQNDETAQFKYDELVASNALVLGEVTYKIFADSWPSRTGQLADRMNSIPKYVATSLDVLEWNNSHRLEGEVAEAIAKLKQQIERDILVAGSSVLVQTLMQHELIDVYRLLVHPLVLGQGKRLFQDGSQANLELVSTKVFGTGMVLLEYIPKQIGDK